MAKYISKHLDSVLKSDSKKILKKHKNLNKSEVLNNLSQFLGWRHYNELKINIKDNSYEKFTDISFLNYKDLSQLKEDYVNYINIKFDGYDENQDVIYNKPLTYEEFHRNYPINRKLPHNYKFLFTQLNFNNRFLFKKDDSNDLPYIIFNLDKQNHFIKINNYDFLIYLEYLVKYKTGRELLQIKKPSIIKDVMEAIIEAYTLDANTSFQFSFSELINTRFPSKNLIHYYENHPQKNKCFLLKKLLKDLEQKIGYIDLVLNLFSHLNAMPFIKDEKSKVIDIDSLKKEKNNIVFIIDIFNDEFITGFGEIIKFEGVTNV